MAQPLQTTAQPSPTGTLRTRVASLLSRQVPHPVYPKIELMVNLPERQSGTNQSGGASELQSCSSEALTSDALASRALTPELVCVRIGDEIKLVGQDELEKLYSSRKKTIRLEEEDPYNYGYEPPMWGVIDWLIVQLRVEHPGEVIEVCIFGGNRAGKTDYAAKRMCECLDVNPDWLVWAFHTDQSSSRAIQQKRFWKYLPLDCKPDTGKSKKGLNSRMNYNKLTGFTENCFALENGAQCVFKFYSGDPDSLEGDEPDVTWSDERIPLNWIRAIGIRLLTKAGRTYAIADLLRPLWEAKKKSFRALEPQSLSDEPPPKPPKLPRVLRAQMWQGVHIVTFTPLDGLTPAVASFLNKARTLASQPAPMLPIIGQKGEVAGYVHMPRVKRRPQYPVGSVWLWNEDNKHGGNYRAMVAKSKQERWSESDKKIKFYGYTEKTLKALFPKVDIDVHVKPLSELPREGTWYHICDPCNGRNWFMLWVLVAPDGTAWVAYEWPPVKDYVPGASVLGEWVKDSEGKKLDGDPGPAQQPLGWGCERYRDEILRIEGKLWRMQHRDEEEAGSTQRRGGTEEEGGGRGGAGDADDLLHGLRNRGTNSDDTDVQKRVVPIMRIMDSRYGNTSNATVQGSTKTIMEMMAELGMTFEKSGQTVAADGENKSRVSEGIQAINDLLDYREDLAKREIGPDGQPSGRIIPDPAQAPKLYVLEICENVIWCLLNYTGMDGLSGAGKDIADVLRYFAICGAVYVPEGAMEGEGGGSY